jgi:5'-3' exonuclease
MNRRPPKHGERTQILNTLLVDGNSLFKRSILGAKDVYNQKQEHIGGVYQFITVIRKLLDDDLYHKVIVFWDGKLSGKLRYNIYKDYKSNRNKDYENGTHPIDENE